jgi:hypothetical protein
VKLLQGGGVEWEQGSDRATTLPRLPGPLAGCGAVRVNCPYGDGPGTSIELAASEDDVQVWGGSVKSEMAPQPMPGGGAL